MGRLNGRRKETEESINEQEKRRQKFFNLNTEKTDWKKVKRASGTHGTVIKYLTFTSLEAQERRNRAGLKKH